MIDARLSGVKLSDRQVQRLSTIHRQLSKMSRLNLFINLKISALEKSINDNIPAELFNNDETTSRDEVKVKALKSGSVQLKVGDGNALYYLVPIKIIAAKDIGLTIARATGEIVLVFKTIININEDWTVSPSTEITDFKWTEKPILKVGFIKLPIESMVTKEIHNQKELIYGAINEQITNALNLQPFIKAGQEHIKAPIKVAEMPQVWLKIHPHQLQMTPLAQEKGRINVVLGAEADVSAFVGDKMEDGDMMLRSIPSLEIVEDISKDSSMTIPIGLTYEEVTRLAATQVKGQTFNWKQWDIKIEEIHLSGAQDKLVNKLTLSGSLEGVVTVDSKPVFNIENQTIEMMDINLTFDSSNFMQKSLFSMAEGFLKKQLSKFSIIDLKPHLKNLVQPLAYQKLTEGVILMSQFNDISIQHLQLMEEGIMASASAEGRIVVMVEELLMG